MKKIVVFVLFLAGLFPQLPVLASTPPGSLKKVSFDELPSQISIDEALWEEKAEIQRSILNSLRYLRSSRAELEYRHFQGSGITRTRVEQSLRRFYLLLVMSRSYEDLLEHLRTEFSIYRSRGMDGRGTVKFTGYFQPVYKASRVRSTEYQYPVFRLPENFDSWERPHPTRVKLEGYDGLGGSKTMLEGYELAWLGSRFEVFMIHVQGSAILEFEDGSKMSVGFAAGTEYPFSGISGEFLRRHNISWHKLGAFFAKKPYELNKILSRNNRFIFFSEKATPDPVGSLGVPVIAGRSIAIDKLRLPPGAIGIIRTAMPRRDSYGVMRLEPASRVVINLDSGSAIKGPGRVDIFMGTGQEAQRMASSIYSKGELYYLFAE